MRTRRMGFTLIELLVVMAIIAMLAALLLPAISDVRRRSITMKCMSNMKSLGTAMLAWGVSTNYVPVREAITSPGEAISYFQTHTWNDNVHNGLYCWTEGGSDGPAKARTIVDNLFPDYVKVGEVFYCPSFNRKTKADLSGTGDSEYVTYENSWNKETTDWWGYEWVNPRWPVTASWASARYPVTTITKAPTPDVVMFCHYSVDHACALKADASVESGRRFLDSSDVPFGW